MVAPVDLASSCTFRAGSAGAGLVSPECPHVPGFAGLRAHPGGGGKCVLAGDLGGEGLVDRATCRPRPDVDAWVLGSPARNIAPRRFYARNPLAGLDLGPPVEVDPLDPASAACVVDFAWMSRVPSPGEFTTYAAYSAMLDAVVEKEKARAQLDTEEDEFAKETTRISDAAVEYAKSARQCCPGNYCAPSSLPDEYGAASDLCSLPCAGGGAGAKTSLQACRDATAASTGSLSAYDTTALTSRRLGTRFEGGNPTLAAPPRPPPPPPPPVIQATPPMSSNREASDGCDPASGYCGCLLDEQDVGGPHEYMALGRTFAKAIEKVRAAGKKYVGLITGPGGDIGGVVFDSPVPAGRRNTGSLCAANPCPDAPGLSCGCADKGPAKCGPQTNRQFAVYNVQTAARAAQPSAREVTDGCDPADGYCGCMLDEQDVGGPHEYMALGRTFAEAIEKVRAAGKKYVGLITGPGGDIGGVVFDNPTQVRYSGTLCAANPCPDAPRLSCGCADQGAAKCGLETNRQFAVYNVQVAAARAATSQQMAAVRIAAPPPPPPPAYVKNDYVVWTADGTDMGGNPRRDTLQGCQSFCDQHAECKGFSRGKHANDGAMDECWFKKDIDGKPHATGSSWVTWRKSG